MKQSPMWAGMELRAHTLTYDGAVMAGLMGGKPLPATRWKAASARTLVIDGERSDAFLRNAAGALAAVLPASKRQTLPGQDHSVVFTAPEALAPVLIDFFLAGKPAGTQKE
jgi:pimeloyl-ACP methyl ester carboxylesterase